MIAKRFATLTAMTIFASSSALSAELPKVIDGAWFDGSGTEVFLPEKAFRSDAITAGRKSLQDLTDLFDEACLQVPVGAEFARSAIERRGDWGFNFIDADAGTSPGARLDGWQSAEMTVTSQGTAWPLAECNVYAARNPIDPIDAVVLIISDRLHNMPAKRTNARRADGKHVTGTTVRWDVKEPSGQSKHVYASVTSQGEKSFLHLAVTTPKPHP